MRTHTELLLHPYQQDYPCLQVSVDLRAAGGQMVPRWKMKQMVEAALVSGLDHLLSLYNTPMVVVEGDDKLGERRAFVEQDDPAKGATRLESVKLSREYLQTLSW